MKTADYAYLGTVGTCKYNSLKGVINTSGFTYVKSNDTNALMAAVALQPVVVGIDSSESVFLNYKSGIISTTACGT